MTRSGAEAQPLPIVRSPTLVFPGVSLWIEPRPGSTSWPVLRDMAGRPEAFVVQQPVTTDGVPASVGSLARICAAADTPVPSLRIHGLLRVRICDMCWAGPDTVSATVEPIRDVAVQRDTLAAVVKEAAVRRLASGSGHHWIVDALLQVDEPSKIADLVCQALFQDAPEHADVLALDTPARLRLCAAALGLAGEMERREGTTCVPCAPRVTAAAPADPLSPTGTGRPLPPLARGFVLPQTRLPSPPPRTPPVPDARLPAPPSSPPAAPVAPSSPPAAPVAPSSPPAAPVAPSSPPAAMPAATPPLSPPTASPAATPPPTPPVAPVSPPVHSPSSVDLPRPRATGPQAPSPTVPEARGAADAGPARNDPLVVRRPEELRSFADVGGMEKLKRELDRTVGVLMRQPQAVREVQYRFNGILLYGPPGVGKSYIAEATAGQFKMNFLRLCIGDILSCWMGDSERRLRQAFATARGAAPCLLFLDEFDALAARRAQGMPDPFSRRLLDQLLVLLDEIDSDSGVVVMAAANDVHALDPAAIREGRFDRQVFVDVPDRPARRAIFATHLRSRRTAGPIDLDDLAERSAGLTAAAIQAIVAGAAGLAIERYERGEIPQPRITAALLEEALRERRGRDRPMLEPKGWEDLVLPADVLRDLQRLTRMIADPDALRRRGLSSVRGALLCGPPGTGKTTIARVIAAQTEGAVNFYPVRGSDLVSGTLGSTAQRVRDLFVRAQQYAPSIIFIDEIESLLHRRGAVGDSAGLERDSVVAEFLAQMDGLDGRPGVFVLGATNFPDKLDPAVRRGGRLTRTIEIPLPDQVGRLALLRLFTRRMTLASEVDLDALAAQCAGMSGADLEALCNEAGYLTLDRDDPVVTAADFAVALGRLRR